VTVKVTVKRFHLIKVTNCKLLRYSGIEGGIRHRLSIAVRGRPPNGSWSGVLFTSIRDCTLKCVGVPVKFPVKGWFAPYYF
jgi:hypothetical protein